MNGSHSLGGWGMMNPPPGSQDEDLKKNALVALARVWGGVITSKYQKHLGHQGNAGGMYHHRINLDRYHPGYFGKVGMRHRHLKKNQLIDRGPWSVSRHW